MRSGQQGWSLAARNQEQGKHRLGESELDEDVAEGCGFAWGGVYMKGTLAASCLLSLGVSELSEGQSLPSQHDLHISQSIIRYKKEKKHNE